MIATLVTFRLGDSFDEARLRQVAEAARSRFEGLSPLRSKVFTVDSKRREAVNFYVWESEEAARAFFSEQLIEAVADLYGSRPTVQYLRVAAVVDNARSSSRSTAGGTARRLSDSEAGTRS